MCLKEKWIAVLKLGFPTWKKKLSGVRNFYLLISMADFMISTKLGQVIIQNQNLRNMDYIIDQEFSSFLGSHFPFK